MFLYFQKYVERMTTKKDNLENFFDDLDNFWWFDFNNEVWFEEENKDLDSLEEKKSKKEKKQKTKDLKGDNNLDWFFDDVDNDNSNIEDNENDLDNENNNLEDENEVDDVDSDDSEDENDDNNENFQSIWNLLWEYSDKNEDLSFLDEDWDDNEWNDEDDNEIEDENEDNNEEDDDSDNDNNDDTNNDTEKDEDFWWSNNDFDEEDEDNSFNDDWEDDNELEDNEDSNDEDYNWEEDDNDYTWDDSEEDNNEDDDFWWNWSSKEDEDDEDNNFNEDDEYDEEDMSEINESEYQWRRNNFREDREDYENEKDWDKRYWNRNTIWSSFNEFNPDLHLEQDVNWSVREEKNQMIIMRQDNQKKYELFKRIFNWISRERWEIFSKQKLQSDEFKNTKLEEFREIDLTIKTLPHSTYLDFTWVNTVDLWKEVNEKELWEFLFEFSDSPLYQKKWLWWIKSQFFWKWKFYVIDNWFLDSNDFYKITTKFVDNWDYESILVWYDLLSNRYIFSSIEQLRHYSVVWASWSWKTVWLVSLVTQYLIKNNTDIIFIEKWTDLEWYLRECERFIYKSDVEVMRYEHIIAIFTYINMELSRRKKIFAQMKPKPVSKIQEYNAIAEKQWKPFMKYLLLVIDEFSRLRDTLWNESKESEEFFLLQLKSLIQVARSYWIYCMLATQNPTSEWWVPSNIQLNLSTKVLWLAEWASSVKYLTHADERAVARQWKIRMWDFLFNAEWQPWMTISRMFKVDQLLPQFIEDWYIVPKTEEEKNKIWISVDDYSNNKINELIQELMKDNSDIELLKSDKFWDYWINTMWLDRISWIRKLSMILIINILLWRFENEVCKKIRETNLNPSNFNMEQEIDKLLDNENYQQLWFIFVLVKSIYFKYLDNVIKVEKISKSEINKAKNWDDASTEAIEWYLWRIRENIVYNVNDTLSRLW